MSARSGARAPIIGFEPFPVPARQNPRVLDLRSHYPRTAAMEEPFEFLFGASGRINRDKYWLSLLRYSIAGLLAAVILFTAAGIAAPLFIIMVVLVFPVADVGSCHHHRAAA
jgi:hypothetical protein